MSMNDTMADMLTRIRNGLHVRRSEVDVIGSRLNRRVVDVLIREGYLTEVHDILDPRGFPAILLAFLPVGNPLQALDWKNSLGKIGRQQLVRLQPDLYVFQ